MANRLKHYRVEAEMTQARLAKVVEVTQPMFPALPKKGRDRDFQGRGAAAYVSANAEAQLLAWAALLGGQRIPGRAAP